MKQRFIILSLLISFASHLDAKTETNLNSSIIGKWKLISSKFEDEPTRPAWLSVIGETQFKQDGSYSSWIQSQTDPSGKIVSTKGTWKLEGNKLSATRSLDEAPTTATVRIVQFLLHLEWDSPEPQELVFRRSIETLGKKEVEGLRLGYRISFPRDWTVITPDSAHTLPAEMQPLLTKKKCRAVAVSPNNDADVSLSVSTRKLTYDLLDVKSNAQIEDLGITTRDIGLQEWRIQKTRFRNLPLYGYNASTYHNYKTIRLVFRFHEDYLNRNKDLYYVLNSLFISEDADIVDSKLGRLISHTCDKPVIIEFGDSVVHFLYPGDDCPHCGQSLIIGDE